MAVNGAVFRERSRSLNGMRNCKMDHMKIGTNKLKEVRCIKNVIKEISNSAQFSKFLAYEYTGKNSPLEEILICWETYMLVPHPQDKKHSHSAQTMETSSNRLNV